MECMSCIPELTSHTYTHIASQPCDLGAVPESLTSDIAIPHFVMSLVKTNDDNNEREQCRLGADNQQPTDVCDKGNNKQCNLNC